MRITVIQIRNKVIWLIESEVKIGPASIIKIQLGPRVIMEIDNNGKRMNLELEINQSQLSYPTELIIGGDNPLIGKCRKDYRGITCFIEQPWSLPGNGE
ncbi:MAG: hypothetical protein ACP5NY_03755 [Thermocladium sp.]|mgnify:FL=1